MITNNVKIYREQKNLTQEDLAKKVNVSRQTVIAIEKGNYDPSLQLALKLSKFFNIKIEELFSLK